MNFVRSQLSPDHQTWGFRPRRALWCLALVTVLVTSVGCGGSTVTPVNGEITFTVPSSTTAANLAKSTALTKGLGANPAKAATVKATSVLDAAEHAAVEGATVRIYSTADLTTPLDTRTTDAAGHISYSLPEGTSGQIVAIADRSNGQELSVIDDAGATTTADEEDYAAVALAMATNDVGSLTDLISKLGSTLGTRMDALSSMIANIGNSQDADAASDSVDASFSRFFALFSGILAAGADCDGECFRKVANGEGDAAILSAGEAFAEEFLGGEDLNLADAGAWADTAELCADIMYEAVGDDADFFDNAYAVLSFMELLKETPFDQLDDRVDLSNGINPFHDMVAAEYDNADCQADPSACWSYFDTNAEMLGTICDDIKDDYTAGTWDFDDFDALQQAVQETDFSTIDTDHYDDMLFYAAGLIMDSTDQGAFLENWDSFESGFKTMEDSLDTASGTDDIGILIGHIDYDLLATGCSGSCDIFGSYVETDYRDEVEQFGWHDYTSGDGTGTGATDGDTAPRLTGIDDTSTTAILGTAFWAGSWGIADISSAPTCGTPAVLGSQATVTITDGLATGSGGDRLLTIGAPPIDMTTGLCDVALDATTVGETSGVSCVFTDVGTSTTAAVGATLVITFTNSSSDSCTWRASKNPEESAPSDSGSGDRSEGAPTESSPAPTGDPGGGPAPGGDPGSGPPPGP